MVLTRPVTRTKISTATFGHPVYDWIVANTPTAWTGVTFQNGWGNVAGIQPVQYRKIGDLIYLRGRMANGTLGATAFHLPLGFRPPATIDLITSGIPTSSWVFGFAALNSDGSYVPYIGGTVAFNVNHSGISITV